VQLINSKDYFYHPQISTACISHLHTPHQHGSSSYLDTSTVSNYLHRHSTGAHNLGIELEPLLDYATYT